MTNDDFYSEFMDALDGGHVAVRMTTRLLPAGGPQTKVFPPTYIGEKTKSGNIGRYAYEERRVNGNTVRVVLLDSVQSQANRMEHALLDAYKSGRMWFPLVKVSFKVVKELQDIGIQELTSLEVPHRLADAIILYSRNERGQDFIKSDDGVLLESASITNATKIFELSPTALVFGQWLSHGRRGGLGNKFPRTVVSEIVGYNAVEGTKVEGRIDPLPISKEVPVYVKHDGEWTLDENEAEEYNKERDKDEQYKREKAGNIGLGNIPPSFEKEGKKLPGGVTISYAEQVGVLSLIAIRRLRFPISGRESPEINKAARAVLATLALCAMSLQVDQGFDLRSRCLLVPDGGTKWELILRDGSSPIAFTLDSERAIKMFNRAVEEAKAVGFQWPREPLTLTPSGKLCDLIKKSIQVQAGEDIEVAE
jgi:CRISPR-associated protein Csb1